MKTQMRSLIVALAAISALNLQTMAAFGQGTAFTYQGQLQNGGSPARGSYNLTFTLFNTNADGAAIAGPVTNQTVSVTNGLFTTLVDFGPGVFAGETNWLQIGVATNGSVSFTVLAPRQELTPTPYTIYAETAGSLNGLVVQSNTNDAPNLIGGSSLNYVSGGVLGATIGGGGAADAGGNSYSNSVTASFGTVSGGVGNVASAYGTAVVGGNGNTASGNGSFVGGGGYDGTSYQGNQAQGNASFVGGGLGNTAVNPYSAVVAGYENIANGNGAFIGGGGYDGSSYQGNQTAGNASVIGGGLGNTINGGADYSAIVGGQGNLVDVESYNSMIGGGQGNTISTYTVLSFIGGGAGNSMYISGGGMADVIGGGEYNGMATYDGSFINDSVISGGNRNYIQGMADTIGGGYENSAAEEYSTVAGGQENKAITTNSIVGGGAYNEASGPSSTVGGGYGNAASGLSSTVAGGGQAAVRTDVIPGAKGAKPALGGGGTGNTASGDYSSVGGGWGNVAGGYAATVPGGSENQALGDYSLAAGNFAQAANNNAFVWSDGSTNTFSTTNNQFVARATGGFVLYSDDLGTGVALPPGSGSWSSMSDRNAKDGFAPVNPQTVLAEVAVLPMTTWSYKSEPGVRHVGPMAQDFHAAFRVGEDERHIADVDEGGVALAAIQGLNQKLDEKDAEIADLQAQLKELKAVVQQLGANQKGAAQ